MYSSSCKFRKMGKDCSSNLGEQAIKEKLNDVTDERGRMLALILSGQMKFKPAFQQRYQAERIHPGIAELRMCLPLIEPFPPSDTEVEESDTSMIRHSPTYREKCTQQTKSSGLIQCACQHVIKNCPISCSLHQSIVKGETVVMDHTDEKETQSNIISSPNASIKHRKKRRLAATCRNEAESLIQSIPINNIGHCDANIVPLNKSRTLAEKICPNNHPTLPKRPDIVTTEADSSKIVSPPFSCEPEMASSLVEEKICVVSEHISNVRQKNRNQTMRQTKQSPRVRIMKRIALQRRGISPAIVTAVNKRIVERKMLTSETMPKEKLPLNAKLLDQNENPVVRKESSKNPTLAHHLPSENDFAKTSAAESNPYEESHNVSTKDSSNEDVNLFAEVEPLQNTQQEIANDEMEAPQVEPISYNEPTWNNEGTNFGELKIDLGADDSLDAYQSNNSHQRKDKAQKPKARKHKKKSKIKKSHTTDIVTPVVHSLSLMDVLLSLSELSFRKQHFKIKKHTLVSALINPCSFPSVHVASNIIVEYLCNSTRNPLLNYEDSLSTEDLIPPAEVCILEALLDVEKKKKLHLTGLMSTFIQCVIHTIYDKNPIHAYGMDSLCRMFALIMRHRNDMQHCLALCMALLSNRLLFAHRGLAAIACIWPEVIEGLVHTKDNEHLVKLYPLIWVKPAALLDEYWKQSMAVLTHIRNLVEGSQD